jgi:hypothetical protein
VKLRQYPPTPAHIDWVAEHFAVTPCTIHHLIAERRGPYARIDTPVPYRINRPRRYILGTVISGIANPDSSVGLSSSFPHEVVL